MNLPNKLTLIRIFLIPIIVIIYFQSSLRNQWILWPGLSVANFIILILIFIGALTDFLDGYIARKKKIVTNLGKFLDPLADKLLTCTGFIILLQQNAYNNWNFAMYNNTKPQQLFEWWMLVIILSREFMVTGIRLLAVGQGKVIAASAYGKAKTTLQFITILFLLAGGAVTFTNGVPNLISGGYALVAKLLLIATVAVTIFSGWDYVTKNLDVLKETKKTLKKNNKNKK